MNVRGFLKVWHRGKAVSGLVEELNFKKVVSVVTVACFLTSFVFGQAVASVVEVNRETKQFTKMFDNFLIPHTSGRITEAKYFGSKKVVINIQDLHCHPEVQKNISKIISILDAKYKLPFVYLEGAMGSLDTSWLGGIEDKKLRDHIVESLMAQGKLTGAEYYSITRSGQS